MRNIMIFFAPIAVRNLRLNRCGAPRSRSPRDPKSAAPAVVGCVPEDRDLGAENKSCAIASSSPSLADVSTF